MYPENFDIDMWTYMSEITDGRLRVVMGASGDTYVVLRLKAGENALSSINKMFEKYIETVQRKELNKDK